MTTQYVMRAFNTSTSNYVYWSVLNSPDMTGAQSGYSPAILTNITVDYSIQVPINGSGGAVPAVPDSDSATWYAATDIYWDPAGTNGGQDSNSGTSAASPVLTWAEIIKRYGSTLPVMNYGQSVTIHVMSSQPANQDPIFFQPQLSGGGQVVITGLSYATLAGSSFSAGTLTGGYGHAGGTPSAGGSPFAIASVPGYVVSGTLLCNSTRSSYAFVNNVSGGNAIVTQPHTLASLTTTTVTPNPTVDNDWVAGDSIQALSLLTINLKRFQPIGGDVTSGGKPCAGWIIGLNIAEPSGLNYSNFTLSSLGSFAVISTCNILGRLNLSSLGRNKSSNYTIFAMNCLFQSTVTSVGDSVIVAGGSTPSGATFNIDADETILENNLLLLGATLNVNGPAQISGVYGSGSWYVFASEIYSFGYAWGSYSLTMYPSSTFWNATGSTFAATALLTTGTISFFNSTTGAREVGGQWIDGITLTPANMDLYGGLLDPISGARFTSGQLSSSFSLANWYAATDIYVDPVSGNDSHAGTSSGTAVKTMAEVIRRYGTTDPVIPSGQNLTIHQLSTQTIGVDDFYFNPRMSGPCYFKWDGLTSAPTVGSTFSPTTLTAKVQTNAGGELKLNGNLPGGAAAGQIVKNVSKNSWAIIKALSSGNATVTQPMANAGLLTVNAGPVLLEDNTWAATDTYQLYQPLICNWKNPAPQGGDGNAGFTLPVAWLQGIHIPDPGGPGASWWSVHPKGIPVFFILCTLDPWVQLNGEDVSGYVWCSACWVNGGCGTAQYTTFNACAINTANVDYSHYGTGCTFDFDTILDNNHVANIGELYFGSVLINGTLLIHYGALVDCQVLSTQAILYGPGSITVTYKGTFVNSSGNSWVSTIKVASLLTLGGNVSAIVGGQIVNNLTLTTANLDTYGSLGVPRAGAWYMGSSTDIQSPGNATWMAATDIYWDPANSTSNASDTNSGTSSGAPLLTFKEIARRWGGRYVQLPAGQVTTLHVMSSQTQAQSTSDPIGNLTVCVPNGIFAIIGTLQTVGATFSAGAVTAPTVGNPGNDLQVAGFPSQTAAGQLVYDSNLTAYAWVDGYSSGTATLSTLFATAPSPPYSAINIATSTPVIGNTLQLYTAPTIYADSITIRANTQTVVGSLTTQQGAGWIANVNFGDPSGTPGTSKIYIDMTGGTQTSMYNVRADAFLQFNGTFSEPNLTQIVNCYFNGGIEANNFGYVYGGIITGASGDNIFVGWTGIKDGTIIHNGIQSLAGSLNFYGAHLASGTATLYGICQLRATYLGSSLWGAGTVQVLEGSALINLVGINWTSALIVNSLLLTSNSYTTGTSYSSGTWTDGRSLTSANLDTYSGLQEPISGARFAK